MEIKTNDHIDTLISHFGYFLRRFFPPTRSIAGDDGTRLSTSIIPSKAFTVTTVASALIMISILLWFLANRISQYFDWPPPIYNAAEVYNLTNEKVIWDVYIGQSPLCSDRDCHLLPSYPAEKYTRHETLPIKEFPLRGYKSGDYVYYRANIKLPQALRLGEETIVFHSLYVHARHYEFYINGTLIDEGSSELLNITIPTPIRKASKELEIAVKVDPTGLPYQGISHYGALVIGPKKLLVSTQYFAENAITTSYLWYLLPKIAFCLMFAFLFLAFSRNREFFDFIAFSFLSTASTFFSSDYPNRMISSEMEWSIFIKITKGLSLLFFILFVKNFFRHNNKKITPIISVLMLLWVTAIPFAHYTAPKSIFSNTYDWASILLQFAGLSYGLFASLNSIAALADNEKGRIRARISTILALFFAFAFIPLGLRTSSIILDYLGIANPFSHSPITPVAELGFMLVLSAITAVEFGLTQSAKERLKADLDAVEAKLELAKSVQQLLLPQSRTGGFCQFKHAFLYRPAMQVSGDWYYRWDRGDQEQLLFVGDVVGKGPQAALAVSVIASILNNSRRSSLTLDAAIEEINIQLYDLFKGKISTTLSAIQLRKQASVRIFAAGSIGWVYLSKAKIEYLPMRSKGLGLSPTATVASKEITTAPGEHLISFTDGCLEGARALKKLIQAFEAIPYEERILSDLNQQVITSGIGSVQDDDQTSVVVAVE